MTEKFSCHLLCQYLTNDYNYFEVERLRFYHEKQTVIFPSCSNIFLQFFSASCIIINQSKWTLTQRLSDEKLKRENNESQYDEEWSHTHLSLWTFIAITQMMILFDYTTDRSNSHNIIWATAQDIITETFILHQNTVFESVKRKKKNISYDWGIVKWNTIFKIAMAPTISKMHNMQKYFIPPQNLTHKTLSGYK